MYEKCGKSLVKHISANHGNFRTEKVLEIFAKVCLAVDWMHRKKIMHKNLTTEHVYLTEDGDLKIGSFGSSKIMAITLQNTGKIPNNTRYRAPESDGGIAVYGLKADIWSLGCILYELVSGQTDIEANER